MKVSLFITCLCDIISSDVGKDTVEVLEKLGCEVDFPEQQTCCGQPAYNSGYLSKSKEAMKQMIRAFKDSEYVVGPSGSCVAMLHEYPKIFKGDPQWEEEANKLAAKSYEFTQFIVDVLGRVDVGSTFKGIVTYHRSCHMTRLLGVKDAPQKLLEHVEGIQLRELPLCEDCCGFGGTFAIKNPEISEQMVKEKTEHIMETEAEYVIGGDMGCLMNIGGRLSRDNRDVKVLHISQVLNS
ncbi:Fe-S oxidoreductase [Pontibacillus yanchengensis]|uniref:Fe-S oxidoreductase n=2 Tax=Pontibacillus yanchengensis TaxID=462910 RepID=A0ACC7VCH8_9BACI|nr:(Fe-S)-binding protein [Pontibacillus yanchengensis]MYL32093.1 Fe-S oxidoreductase [Pontibacillus yanchengensis]MYL52673.1 Fe-S oxidoreductase [Pontibacillus yanchengensis]